MLEDRLASEVIDEVRELGIEEVVDKTEEEEIAEAWVELEDSDFKIDKMLDEEKPEEIELEINFAEDELEDKGSDIELELVVEEGEDMEEDNLELLLTDDEELHAVDDLVLIEEPLHTSTEEHTFTRLQFLRVVVVVAVLIPVIVPTAVVVTALPRMAVVAPSSAVAVIVSPEHCSSYMHTVFKQLEEELDLLENADKLELEILDSEELTVSFDELEDNELEEERDEDKVELLGEDEELLLVVKEELSE